MLISLHIHVLHYTIRYVLYYTGQLPCVPIASSTTAYGRNLLLSTREFVESTYTVLNGYPHNAEVFTNERYLCVVYMACIMNPCWLCIWVYYYNYTHISAIYMVYYHVV